MGAGWQIGLERRRTRALRVSRDLVDAAGASVPALAGCARLHNLRLANCENVTDVSALANCASLHTLNLNKCPGVTDR